MSKLKAFVTISFLCIGGCLGYKALQSVQNTQTKIIRLMDQLDPAHRDSKHACYCENVGDQTETVGNRVCISVEKDPVSGITSYQLYNNLALQFRAEVKTEGVTSEVSMGYISEEIEQEALRLLQEIQTGAGKSELGVYQLCL